MKRVTAGRTYRYDPVMLDQFDPRTKARPGDLLTVVNLPGCPPANTMRMCHVNDAEGNFAGLVCVGSLEPTRAKVQA